MSTPVFVGGIHKQLFRNVGVALLPEPLINDYLNKDSSLLWENVGFAFHNYAKREGKRSFV